MGRNLVVVPMRKVPFRAEYAPLLADVFMPAIQPELRLRAQAPCPSIPARRPVWVRLGQDTSPFEVRTGRFPMPWRCTLRFNSGGEEPRICYLYAISYMQP